MEDGSGVELPLEEQPLVEFVGGDTEAVSARVVVVGRGLGRAGGRGGVRAPWGGSL